MDRNPIILLRVFGGIDAVNFFTEQRIREKFFGKLPDFFTTVSADFRYRIPEIAVPKKRGVVSVEVFSEKIAYRFRNMTRKAVVVGEGVQADSVLQRDFC